MEKKRTMTVDLDAAVKKALQQQVKKSVSNEVERVAGQTTSGCVKTAVKRVMDAYKPQLEKEIEKGLRQRMEEELPDIIAKAVAAIRIVPPVKKSNRRW